MKKALFARAGSTPAGEPGLFDAARGDTRAKIPGAAFRRLASEGYADHGQATPHEEPLMAASPEPLPDRFIRIAGDVPPAGAVPRPISRCTPQPTRSRTRAGPGPCRPPHTPSGGEVP